MIASEERSYKFHRLDAARGCLTTADSRGARGWIHDGAELAAVAHGEEQGVVAVEGREAAAGRARRRLRLHHLGAQVGQEPPAQLAEIDGQVDHPEAGQRSNRHGSDVTPRRPREWREGGVTSRTADPVLWLGGFRLPPSVVSCCLRWKAGAGS